MLKVGIIGAGSISANHLGPYRNNPQCELVAIADLNLELAKKRAEEYDIPNTYRDYKELLANEEIDAVSIVTPTFTHTDIVIDALKAGKHVLCEKPPALHADDVRKCAELAKETGKLLMYAFVCRFKSDTQYVKKYIEKGKVGPFLYARATRLSRCIKFNGWFCDKTKSGGHLMDTTIHEIDLLLYLMGYPKPKSVLGFTSMMNSDLPDKIQGHSDSYDSADTTKTERTIESFATAKILLDNGACLDINSSSVMLTKSQRILELYGKNAGINIALDEKDQYVKIMELTEDNYFNESLPYILQNKPYQAQVDHFADCCLNGTECICKTDEAVTLIELVNALYASAESGKTIEF